MALGESRFLDPKKRLGQRLGDFEVKQFLARGGFGFVYLIENLYGEKRAAKFFETFSDTKSSSRKFLSPNMVSRIEKENRRHSRFVHPNIVRVFDFYDDPLAITMELMTGGSLESRMKNFTLEDSLLAFAQISDGLALLHENGMVHRDIKAPNVLYAENSSVAKLSDFGLAMYSQQLATILKTSIDRGRGLSGTKGLMAPEHEFFGDVSYRSDVYELGALLFAMITKKYPSHPDSHPSEFVSVPPEIDNLVARALKEDKFARFDDARQMRLSLNDVWPNAPPVVYGSYNSPERKNAQQIPAGGIVLEIETSTSQGLMLPSEQGISPIIPITQGVPITALATSASISAPIPVQSSVPKKSLFRRILTPVALLAAGALGVLGFYYFNKSEPSVCYLSTDYSFGDSSYQSEKGLGLFRKYCEDNGIDSNDGAFDAVAQLDARDGVVDNVVDFALLNSLVPSGASSGQSDRLSFSDMVKFESDSDREIFMNYVKSTRVPFVSLRAELKKYVKDSLLSRDDMLKFFSSVASLPGTTKPPRDVVSLNTPSKTNLFNPADTSLRVVCIYDFDERVLTFSNEFSRKEGLGVFHSLKSHLGVSDSDLLMMAKRLDSEDGSSDGLIELSSLYDPGWATDSEYERNFLVETSWGRKIVSLRTEADEKKYVFGDFVSERSFPENDVSLVFSEVFRFYSRASRAKFVEGISKLESSGDINYVVVYDLLKGIAGGLGIVSDSDVDSFFKSLETPKGSSVFEKIEKSKSAVALRKVHSKNGRIVLGDGPYVSANRNFYFLRLAADYTFADSVPQKLVESAVRNTSFGARNDVFFKLDLSDSDDGRIDGIIGPSWDLSVLVDGKALSTDVPSGRSMRVIREYYFSDKAARDSIADLLNEVKTPVSIMMGLLDSDKYGGFLSDDERRNWERRLRQSAVIFDYSDKLGEVFPK